MATSLLAVANLNSKKSAEVVSAMHEELYKLLAHVHAQTSLISGEGLENFCNHSDEIKSNYLWSICDAAERAMALLDRAGAA